MDANEKMLKRAEQEQKQQEQKKSVCELMEKVELFNKAIDMLTVDIDRFISIAKSFDFDNQRVLSSRKAGIVRLTMAVRMGLNRQKLRRTDIR